MDTLSQFKIKTKLELSQYISADLNALKTERKHKGIDQVFAALKKDLGPEISKFLILSRRADYHQYRMRNGSLKHILGYIFYTRKKNSLGLLLGMEVDTRQVGPGLRIHHRNIILNGHSNIGCNCTLHGFNIIGNNGFTNDCPVIGDNVRLGAGAKIIGAVRIPSNTIIAAGAVVVKSFEEEGITIAGVPAVRIK